MLIQFSVKNFRSFKGLQTLSLVQAETEDSLKGTHTFKAGKPKPIKLLKSAVLYGPNAGGKSNFLMAAATMRSIVLLSAQGQRGTPLPIKPFLLDEKTSSQPSEFEVDFLVNGVRCQYGFAATSEQVTEEWLVSWPKGVEKRWFHRAWDKKGKSYKWDFGDADAGSWEVWQKTSRSNALFLSTAVQLNNEQLQPIYDWFQDALQTTSMPVMGTMLTPPANWLTASLCTDEMQKKQVLAYLQAADFGIQDLAVESSMLAEDARFLETLDKLAEDTKASLLESMQDAVSHDVKMLHQTMQDKLVAFDFHQESAGTRKFFSMLGHFIRRIKEGGVLFVDELDSSMHVKLLECLLNLVHNKAVNTSNAQLVFTTHETALLNSAVLRRDQIWFCERDKGQASHLYPLTDFEAQGNREDHEAIYLSGQYGAVPYINMSEMRQVSDGHR